MVDLLPNVTGMFSENLGMDTKLISSRGGVLQLRSRLYKIFKSIIHTFCGGLYDKT